MTNAILHLALLSCAAALCACSPEGAGARGAYPQSVPRRSSTIALSADGATLAVVNPDADSLSLLSTGRTVDPSRPAADLSGTPGLRLLREIPLAPRPTQSSDGRYEPTAGPRAVDLSPDGRLAYVACQWSGEVLVVDTAAAQIVARVVVGAEPVAVLVHHSGAALYVSAYQSGEVLRLPLDADGLPSGPPVRRNANDRPFGLALDPAGDVLYASRFLLAPGVDLFDAATLAPRGKGDLLDVPPGKSHLVPHGVPRGVYDVAVRPGSGELWLPHLLLSTDVAQPKLDFESTVFPAVSLRDPAGAPLATLSVKPRVPGVSGAFADVVSGPRALAFTPDGALALLVDMSSEDVLVIDAARRVQVGLVRPLPGDLPEGIAVSPDGRFAYVDERASADVAVLDIDPARAEAPVRLAGPAIPRLQAADPMPPDLRLGQRLFYSANSAEFPMTQNFWVACASCHLESRSDGVVWLFAQGPRDTPSNAGGTRGTGFLLHTALRNSMLQYDETIRVEQGGDMDLRRPADRERLAALGEYVDRAIPLPRSPEVDPATRQPSAAAQRGRQVFARFGCAACHGGPRFTDSGEGNPGLDLSGQAGPVRLHDVGTCDNGTFPDQSPPAVDGSPRPRCQFDTPSLQGAFDSAPYFHNGSAATLGDVVDHFARQMGLAPAPTERADLIAYLRSL